MSKLASGRAECQDRINAALSTFGSWAGNGAAFTLALSPSDEALDAAVAVDSSWAEGLLYTSIAELLEQMNTNLQAQPAAVGSAVAKAASKRVLQISIDESSGGLMTGVSVFRDGRLDLVFRAQSLKTNQYGWSEIGNDIAETVKAFKPPAAPAPVKAAPAPTTTVATPGRSARGPPPTAGARGGAVSAAPKAAAPPKAAPAPASSFGAMGDALSANLAERQSAIDAQLAKLAAFVGDGAPWKVQLAASAASMDASVTREASYMENLLFGTVVEFLEFINSNVRRYATGELLAQASSARTIVFEFVDTDDCPRQYLGAFQAVVKGAKLHFVGPACDFKSNGGGAPNIGRDVENAVMAAAGDTGPTEREKKVAESLAAIAASSSKTGGGGETGGGGGGGGAWKPNADCRMCKGTGKRACNHCHGKGGSCKPCEGSGWSAKFKCIGDKHKK